jgi:hypothetical protein
VQPACGNKLTLLVLGSNAFGAILDYASRSALLILPRCRGVDGGRVHAAGSLRGTVLQVALAMPIGALGDRLKGSLFFAGRNDEIGPNRRACRAGDCLVLRANRTSRRSGGMSPNGPSRHRLCISANIAERPEC